MIDNVQKDECVLCKACSQICPVNCISFTDNYLSFDYPKIDTNICVGCNLCEKVCPVFNDIKSESLKECYAMKNKEINVLQMSSSGGVFYSIASYFLKNNGVVVGVLFDDMFNVKHDIIEDISDLNKLCGSKYVQSDINNIFVKVKDKLNENKLVLFVGTACQTAALTSYLGNKPENLFLVDFICHSVVSKNVFDEYKDYLENKYKGKITDFKFRDKTEGWLNSGLKVTFSNGKVYSSPLYKDIYMQGYFKNINTKEACKTCKYKNFKSNSDVTLGDFWGVETLYPEFYDYYGNSIAVLNTVKGKKIFDNIKSEFDYKLIKLSDVINYNKSLITPFDFGEDRTKYFEEAKKMGYIKPLEKYVKTSTVKKIFIKLRKLIKKN